MEEEKQKEGQLTLNQMLRALDKDVAKGLEKRLKKLSKRKAIKAPLEKTKADQVARKAAYSDVTKEVSQWESIVEKNRHAKQLKFPLDQEPDYLPKTSESLGELKPANEFEAEVQNVMKTSQSALHDNQMLSKAEEKYLKAISVEEAAERHRELQRMRVLMSSFAARMRRQKAIKSKSYRRLLKQERLKKHMKKVETNKDMLMDEIEKLTRLRAQERASLKHKNTGKWAKHAKFRSKYDDEARKAMLEQIGLAEKLLERPAVDESDSDEEDAVSVSDDSEDEKETTKPNPSSKTPKSVDISSMNDQLIKSSDFINKRSNKRKLDDQAAEDEKMEDDDDEEEDDEQRKLMSEAFADDDVVAEFQEAKDKMADEEQPKDVDNFLPGWGGWAGPGIKVRQSQREKYIIRAKKLPRRDDRLGNVIISEKADDKIKDLMIEKLPRGFKNEYQLMKAMNKPVAASFLNQSTHRDVIKPRIETKMGARIEPISKKTLKGSKAKWA